MRKPDSGWAKSGLLSLPEALHEGPGNALIGPGAPPARASTPRAADAYPGGLDLPVGSGR